MNRAVPDDSGPHRPSEKEPQPVPGHPAWFWWRGEDGHPRARAGLLRIQAHNDKVLLARIRAAEQGRKP